jgi:hypothetical protein
MESAPRRVLADAWRTRPRLQSGGNADPSAAFCDPVDVLLENA